MGIDVQDSYKESALSTVSSTFKQESSIDIYMAELSNNNYSYNVTPLVYWSKYGYIVVDYIVDIPIPSGPSNGWVEDYGQAPDPAFCLPMRGPTSDTSNHYKNFTREIEFMVDSTGTPTALEITVQNYSLYATPATNVVVNAYDGNPAQGGKLIGSGTIPSLPPRTPQNVRIPWNGTKSKTSYIYCVIDPDNSISEIHEWNNLGWAKFPPKEVQ